MRQVLEKESSSVNKYIQCVAIILAVFFLAATPVMAQGPCRPAVRRPLAIGAP